MTGKVGMTAWHLDPEGIRRYVEGTVGPELAASAEAHLLACASCRATLASHVDTGRSERIWRAVIERVDAPRRSLLEWTLVRLGVAETTARLVSVTPTLRGPWLFAIAGVLAFVAVAAQADERFLQVFLVVAPLGPLAGVAVAFAGGLDPTREIGLAAPYSGVRLLLIRTAAVLTATVPVVALLGLVLPGSNRLAAAWLLPAAGLTCAALALTGRLVPVVAVGVVATAWVLVTAPAALVGHLDIFFGTGAQVCWLVVAIGGGVWLVAGRNTMTIKLGRNS